MSQIVVIKYKLNFDQSMSKYNINLTSDMGGESSVNIIST